MSEYAVPATEWPQFCETYSSQHRGWLVGMRELETHTLNEDSQGPAPVATPMFSHDRVLQEVRAALSQDYADILVTVGEGSDETSFLIENAIALYQLHDGDAHRGLRIDGADGKTVLMEFRTAAEPSSLDGLAQPER